jgi:nucleoid-associated protein YgaU
MTLKEKYGDVLDLSLKLGVKNGNVIEEGGKLKLWGTTEYQLEANQLWDKIKAHPGWENEIVADIKPAQHDLFGFHTVESGDTLSKIAKKYLGDSNAYMKIFNVNKDVLNDPNVIKPGQKLKIPAQ